jgi:hypothetical protein
MPQQPVFGDAARNFLFCSTSSNLMPSKYRLDREVPQHSPFWRSTRDPSKIRDVKFIVSVRRIGCNWHCQAEFARLS